MNALNEPMSAGDEFNRLIERIRLEKSSRILSDIYQGDADYSTEGNFSVNPTIENLNTILESMGAGITAEEFIEQVRNGGISLDDYFPINQFVKFSNEWLEFIYPQSET